MSFCVSNPLENKKLFIQPVEVCSILALKELQNKTGGKTAYAYNNCNIFNSDFNAVNKDINGNFRNKDANTNNEFIYNNDNNKKDLCHKVNDNEWVFNCALQKFNPLYTYNSEIGKCTLIPNLTLPDGFKLNQEKGKSYIYYDIKEHDNPDYPTYVSQQRKAYCENSWYDWMIVPNFHFDNQYEKDSGNFSKLDVRKCYKPCDKGMFPYVTSEDKRICIPKAEALDGLYMNKLDFSPIAMINLIGNTEETIKQLYDLLKYEKYNTFNKKDLSLNTDVYTKIDDKNECDFCYMETIISTFTNLISPDTIDIQNFQNSKDIISYKNPLFNEDDPNLLTLRGMANTQMLNDAILVHTYLIAHKYNKFLKEDIKKIDNYFQGSTINYDKIKNHSYNIYNTLNKKIDYIKNSNIKRVIDIRNKYKRDIDSRNLDKYYQRLANIFYKAINVCYNNETNFSINLIRYTQSAFDNIKSYIADNNPSIYGMTTITADNYNISDIDRIEIDFIDIPTLDKIPLREYLEALMDSGLAVNQNTNTDDKRNDFLTKIFSNFYNRTKGDEVFFYTQELIERKGGCKTKQIPNPDNNSITKCLKCETVCKDKESCESNPHCAVYCPEQYHTYVTSVIDNSGEGDGKCGVIKKKLAGTYDNPNNKIEHKTPLDDEIKIPEFNNLLNICLKIIFFLLAFYMAYIFYQVYGETFFSIINLIIIKMEKFIHWLLAGAVAQYNKNNIVPPNENEYAKNIAKMEKEYIDSKYEKVVRKIDDLSKKHRMDIAAKAATANKL